MKSVNTRILHAIIGLGLGLSSAIATADDTELFVAQSGGTASVARPNILFLYDNSGSMASAVVTQEPWNTATIFNGCYNANELYFSFDGSKPGCNSNNYVDKNVNYCAAATTPLTNLGQYTGRLLAWRSNQNKWVALSNTHNRPVECQADRGVHGQTAGSASKYAANGNGGPWAGNATNEPTWNQDVTIFDGNWLNWNSTGGSVTKTRIEIIQEVTDNLLDTMNDVNVGLEHFNDNQGGTIAHAIEDIATARTSMKGIVDGLQAETWTPLSESLYEGANYYMGRNVDYGNVGPVKSVAASRVGNSIFGTQYLKPGTYACQKNYIVILTDGLPTQDVGATAKIKALPNWATTVTQPNCSMTGDGACMIDLAEYLQKHDLDPTLAGVQNVTTYTVGFGTDLQTGDTTFLQATAQKGGGKYYLATDTASLSSALTKIVTDILNNSTTFSAPTAPVNSFNRTTNLDDMYVSVFAPSGNMHWSGNLKKYRLQNGQLVGQDGNPAVNPNTGFFADSAFSYWSAAVDGSNAETGGAASKLPVYTGRNFYTNLSGSHLNTTANNVDVSNSAITPAMVGAPDSTTRDSVLNWSRGLDLQDENDNGDTTDVRHVMGDPLHVRPVSVIYGGTAANPDMVVFVSTNDGYMHAINSADGTELWSFIPTRLLGRLYALFQDNPVTARSYGLDGDIRVYILNDDGVAGISGSERVLLYFGMRRGGDSVFALDVTNRNDPQILWEINSTTAGLSNLGETWSTPTIANVNVGGTARLVAIFGGGYDDGEDNAGYRTDSVGRSIYMVDALTGSLIWKAGSTVGNNLVLPLNHSIPAPIAVLDMTGDHLADRMYVGDMGGRVWRFDIFNGQPAATLVTGGILATLGAADMPSPTLPNVRRFYATPDVAQVVSAGKTWLSINIGSGHREHPLDTGTQDEFYSIRDFNVGNQLALTDYVTPTTRTDLVDITGNVTPTLATTAKGWRLSLLQSPGEKVVTQSTTFASTVLFTSFAPGGSGDACVAAGGLNRFYAVSVLDGHPVTNLDGSQGSNNLTAADRSMILKQTGIGAGPTLFFPDYGSQAATGTGSGGSGLPPNCPAGLATCPLNCNIGGESCPPFLANPPIRTLWTQTGTE